MRGNRPRDQLEEHIMTAQQTITAQQLQTGDRIIGVGSRMFTGSGWVVDHVHVGMTVELLTLAGGRVDLPRSERVVIKRESTSGYGVDDRCVDCGEHLSDPHAVGCPRGDQPETPEDRRMSAYAAKIAAETILAEPPSEPDLTDVGILERLSRCVRPARVAELDAIRTAFIAEYVTA